MKIIALMLVRSEEWVIRLCAEAARRWVDGTAAILHDCHDGTLDALLRTPNLRYEHAHAEDQWREMDLRQRLLELGREMGGTHFALIDADEVVTANVIPRMREYFFKLEPGQLLELPMIPVWRGFDKYRHDASVWSRSWLTVGFRDAPSIEGWAPRGKHRYQYHNRPPAGHSVIRARPIIPGDGGAFHLQWAAWHRMIWKHRLYYLTERIRWPDRRTPDALLRIYGEAGDESGLFLKDVPAEWWGDLPKHLVDLDHEPWHKAECERLLREHGRGILADMDLWGWPDG